MKLPLWLIATSVIALSHLAPAASGQAVDGSDIRQHERKREELVNKLSADEQLKLRAAQEKAVQDPEVVAAIQKRNRALEEFATALRASMLKTDPQIQVILDKIAAGASPGF